MISLIKLLLEVSIDQLKQQWVDSGKISPEIFDRICRTVHNNSNWATWLTKRVSQGYIAEEDIEQWETYMQTFERYKVRFQTKDINTLKTPEQIADFAHECITVQQAADERTANTGGEKMKGSKEERKREVDKFRLPDYKSLRGDTFEVFKLPKEKGTENQKYAIELGTGTTWCIASRGSRNWYKDYIPKGPLYIFINKSNPEEKYQIHIETDQFKDKKDQEINYVDEFYYDFYNYLQRVDNVNLPKKAQEAYEKVVEIKDFFKTHDRDKLLAERHLPDKIKSDDNWYCLDLSKKEDRMLYYLLKIDIYNNLNATIYVNMVVPMVFVTKHYYYDYYCFYENEGKEIDLSKYIKTEGEYQRFISFIKHYNIDIESTQLEELAISFDKNLPDADEFYIGEVQGCKLYNFKKDGKNPLKAKIKLGVPRLSSDMYYIISEDGSSRRFSFELKDLEYEMFTRHFILKDINDSLKNIKDTLARLKELIPEGRDIIENLQKRANRIDEDLNEIAEYLKSAEQLHVGDKIFYKITDRFPNIKSYNLDSNREEGKYLEISLLYLGSDEIKAKHIQYVSLLPGDEVFKIGINNSNRLEIYNDNDRYINQISYLKSYFNLSDIQELAEKLHAKLPIFVENALEKEKAKKAGTLAPTVKQLLEQRQDDFRECDITKVRPRTVEGIEGTWQEFGPSIKRSSNWGDIMQQDLENNDWTARIVLYWNYGDWNLFCQMKDQEGQVKKIWERSGRGMGVVWKSQNVGQNLHESFLGTGYSKLIEEYLY